MIKIFEIAAECSAPLRRNQKRSCKACPVMRVHIFFSTQTPYKKMRRLGLRTTAFMPLPFSQSALTQTFPTAALRILLSCNARCCCCLLLCLFSLCFQFYNLHSTYKSFFLFVCTKIHCLKAILFKAVKEIERDTLYFLVICVVKFRAGSCASVLEA